MKLLLLISGGIDSPVAGALALKGGHEISAVHFHNYPFTDEKSREKALKNLQHLSNRFGKKISVFVVKYGPVLSVIAKKCGPKLTCVLCKRGMYRIAEKIAAGEKCPALLTGDSLAQVASQTLYNLAATTRATHIPVIRPLIGLDKTETIKLAKIFGTFGTSIEKAAECAVVPKKPATMAKKSVVEGEEQKIGVEELVKKAVQECEKIAVKPERSKP